MASRIKRYKGAASIKESATEIIYKKANIVLHDGRVFLGTIKVLDDHKLQYINTRNTRNELGLSNIYEIIIDSKA